MASLTDITAPGAYPTTPQAEDPTSQTQHTEMQGREDPHGRGSGLEQGTHPSGHNFAGSGIYVDESSLAHGAGYNTSSHHNPAQQTSRSKEIPRSLGNDMQHNSRQFAGNSAVDADDSSKNRSQQSGDKSGPMTGAYSRVGTQEGSFAPVGNYTYDTTAPSEPTHAASSQPGTEGARASTATNPESGNPTSTARNTATDGGEGQSNAKHDPYWGDIPFGTGVYNGVTGHGSKEPITHQGSLHDEYGTGANQGVYNSVTGHGSKESRGREAFDERSRDLTTTEEESSQQQRKFPLVGGTGSDSRRQHGHKQEHDGKHEHKHEDSPKSHAKEVLAGAGATGAAGYAAHDFFGRRRDDTAGKDTDAMRADENRLPGRGGLAGAQSHIPHHGQRDQGVASTGEWRQGPAHKPVAAAPVPAEKRMGFVDNNNNSLANEKYRDEDSHLQYLGAAVAAAGVGAGAGAYGMHEHSARDNMKENPDPSVRGGNEVLLAAPSSTTRELAKKDTQPLSGAAASRQEHTRDSNLVPGMQHQGLGRPSVRQSDNHHPSGVSRAADNGGESGAMHGDARAGTENVIADPSYGGRYNLLSSGTPSGISIDPSHSSSRQSGH
ncbi:hypothetical protein F5Y14DRAFT_336918 [Nemania sp. NC0429]|nr:hypothetical protein F5Y14DRAFT_336918 [Nemania sp. NC0429]